MISYLYLIKFKCKKINCNKKLEITKKTNYNKVKVAQVTIDEQTQKPGWIATKVDENGDPIIDDNNNLNNWIIDDSTFRKKYETDPENPNLCKPKRGPQTFVEIPDNIILNQWGEDMAIAAGGYINITNPDDMYGISQRDFEDTYKYIDELCRDAIRLKYSYSFLLDCYI